MLTCLLTIEITIDVTLTINIYRTTVLKYAHRYAYIYRCKYKHHYGYTRRYEYTHCFLDTPTVLHPNADPH